MLTTIVSVLVMFECLLVCAVQFSISNQGRRHSGTQKHICINLTALPRDEKHSAFAKILSSYQNAIKFSGH
jgi:hypothetical protein